MTTYIPFVVSQTSAFSFNATLGGSQYTITITWNMSGQRWYFNLATLQQVPVLAVALIGSPPDYDINLVQGFITGSTVVYRVSTGNFEINP